MWRPTCVDREDSARVLGGSALVAVASAALALPDRCLGFPVSSFADIVGRTAAIVREPTLFGLALCAYIIAFLWLFSMYIHASAQVNGRWKLHRKPQIRPREEKWPGVSIIKPLLGVDPNLFSNLETFFNMDYPQFELLFCIQDESDAAIMLVRKLLEKYPHIDARVFIGGEKVGVNPKINNMQPGYRAAKYELVLISDSGIRMKEDTLSDMASHMTDNVGMVHQMPFTCDRPGFPATLEKIYFGTVQARMYLAADLLRINCSTGMSAMMRKSVIDEEGGIKAFGSVLAEDFFLAKTIIDKGLRLAISSQPAWQNSGICDIPSFYARLARWAKLRIAMVPATIILEPLSECMVLGGASAWAVSFIFQWDPLVFFLVHVLVWFLFDWFLLCSIQNGSVPFSKAEFVIGWLFREVSALYLFLHALSDPVIRWRTGMFKLRWGGIAEEVITNSNIIKQ